MGPRWRVSPRRADNTPGMRRVAAIAAAKAAPAPRRRPEGGGGPAPPRAALRPRLLLFTNLFRDQLDRYGEVEHVAALWRDAVRGLDAATVIVLNADDPPIAAPGGAAPG